MLLGRQGRGPVKVMLRKCPKVLAFWGSSWSQSNSRKTGWFNKKNKSRPIVVAVSAAATVIVYLMFLKRNLITVSQCNKNLLKQVKCLLCCGCRCFPAQAVWYHLICEPEHCFHFVFILNLLVFMSCYHLLLVRSQCCHGRRRICRWWRWRLIQSSWYGTLPATLQWHRRSSHLSYNIDVTAVTMTMWRYQSWGRRSQSVVSILIQPMSSMSLLSVMLAVVSPLHLQLSPHVMQVSPTVMFFLFIFYLWIMSSACRVMTGVKWLDKVSNTTVLTVFRNELIHTVHDRQLCFLGHMLRNAS